MTLKPDEFIRRFLMHVLPNGFHRIRHSGLLASGTKTETIARIRELITTVAPVQTAHQPRPRPGNRPGDPPVPVLRRSHEHHRDLQPRLDTTIQTAAANRDQDRYVMITFPTSQIQNPVLPRRPSIRHGGARANMPLPRQRRHRSSWLTADSRTCDRPIMRRNVVSQHTHRRRALMHLRRAQTSIALGARGATACHFPRVPSLKAFGRRPRCKPHRCDRPASETLNNSRLMHRMPTASLFVDHRVGACKQRRWYDEAERLGSLEVDHQLILDWGLDRKLARHLPLRMR